MFNRGFLKVPSGEGRERESKQVQLDEIDADYPIVCFSDRSSRAIDVRKRAENRILSSLPFPSNRWFLLNSTYNKKKKKDHWLTLKEKRSRGNHIDVSSKSISQLVVTKVNLNFFSLNYLSCRECQYCFSRVSAARLDANGPIFN